MSSKEEPNDDYSEGPSTTLSVDGEEETASKRRKGQAKEDKVCRVCGDKALGYNFNAITCESCKAFFRRNALKEKTVKCLFDNKCVVDLLTRRFCPACRIKKCFSIGMNPQMILDDKGKRKRLSKVTANRLKNRSASTSDSSLNSPSPLLMQMKAEPETETTQDISSSDLMDSSSSSHLYSNVTERPATPVGKLHGNTPVEIFRHPSPELIPTDQTLFFQLPSEEDTCLTSITQAYRNTLAVMPEPGPHSEEKEYQRAADLINYSEIAVRKLIMFVKYLHGFKMMSQQDQISLLKSCIMNTLLLRSALFYSIEKDAWITAKCEIPSSILKCATGFHDLHNSHVYYCRRVKSMALNDYSIYALLQVLIIFDPSAKNISDRPFVASIQDRYFILLKHYFESRYSYNFAKEYYVSTIDRLCDLKALSEEHAKILLQVKPVEVEPLMLEVLNLN